MKITTGTCIGCKEKFAAKQGRTHLKKCAGVAYFISTKGKSKEGFLLRISWREERSMYWMFVLAPKNLKLDDLDEFLRDEWLECCGHLSSFTINGESYSSYEDPDFGSEDLSTNKRIGPLFYPGLKIDYVYDFGSSTELVLEVLDIWEDCPQGDVTILMKNDFPDYSCEICKKKAELICCLCAETTCKGCCKDHSCAKEEGDTYMFLPLVNSPRTGVCGYDSE